MNDYSNYIGIFRTGVSWNPGIYLDLGSDHLNKWIFIAMTKEGSSITIYGRQNNTSSGIQTTGILSWTLNSTSSIFIGRDWNGGMEIFDGVIDDVYIFNRSISVSEQEILYCSPNVLFRNNSTCLKNCPEGQYFNSTECAQCSNNCKTCQINSENCSSCFNGKQLYNNSCLANCPEGYFNNVTECSKCNVSACKTCINSSNTCVSCESNLVLQNQSCISNCPEGFFQVLTGCEKCNASACKTCINSTNVCTSCESTLVLQNQSCQSNCPEGFFQVLTECQKCNASVCKSCINSTNVCTSCESTLVLYNQSCQSNCPEGFFQFLTECRKCNASACKTCNNSENTCTDCANFQTLCNNKCQSLCPTYKQQFDQKLCRCQYCSDSNCINCKSNFLCTQCASGFGINWFNETSNVCEKTACLTSEQRLNGLCYACPNQCKSCISEKICLTCFPKNGLTEQVGDVVLCAPCKANENWINNLCLPSCQSGQYLNMSSKACQICEAPCKDCFNQTHCISCINKLFLTEKKECNQTCPTEQLIENISSILYSNRCPIKNCKECQSVLECKQCNPSYFVYNGQCIAQCPSSMPANSFNVCASSKNNENNEIVEQVKADFENSLLSIIALDSENNNISIDNIELSQGVSSNIIESFLNITENIETNTVDNIWTNSMISNLIDSAIVNKINNQTNASVDELSDNKNGVISLCEATKMTQLSNYSKFCKDLVSNYKNAKMTLEQTKNLIDLILTSSIPRIIKKRENNTSSLSSEAQSIQTSIDREQLRDTFNSTSNSICIRSTNDSSMLYSLELMDIAFANISSQTTFFNHPNSAFSLNIIANFTNQYQNGVQNSYELDPSLEIVPKNNESFVSKVVQGKILKYCSASLSNEKQPIIVVFQNDIKISINFTVSDDATISTSQFVCAFLDQMNAKLVDEKQSKWDIFGAAEVEKLNNGKLNIVCKDQNQIGFFAVLNDPSYSPSKSNGSLIIIICVSIAGAIVLGLSVFLLQRFLRKKPEVQTLPSKQIARKDRRKESKAKEKQKKTSSTKSKKNKKP